MRRVPTVATAALALAGLSHCTTEVCGCTPAILSAVVMGRVLEGPGTPVEKALVSGYSAAGSACRSLDADFGTVTTGADGSFELPLSAYDSWDSVCVYVFARPPVGASGLENSDTALLVMDFRTEEPGDTAQVELILHARPGAR